MVCDAPIRDQSRTPALASDLPALVAQGIEQRPPEPCAGVRIAPRALRNSVSDQPLYDGQWLRGGSCDRVLPGPGDGRRCWQTDGDADAVMSRSTIRTGSRGSRARRAMLLLRDLRSTAATTCRDHPRHRRSTVVVADDVVTGAPGDDWESSPPQPPRTNNATTAITAPRANRVDDVFPPGQSVSSLDDDSRPVSSAFGANIAACDT